MSRGKNMTTNKVTTIDLMRPAVTLINVYEVAPDKQADLARLLAGATERVMRNQTGFISVSIHRSLDGTKVANYAQWASKEDLERMMKSPDAQAQIKQFAALAKSASPAIYEVSSIHVG
jgi:quinol monooxygenase YgiN